MQSDVRLLHTAALYPTYGYRLDGQSTWAVPVSGAVHLATIGAWRQAIWSQVLRRLVQATPDVMECDVFRRRVNRFAAQAQRGQWVTVVPCPTGPASPVATAMPMLTCRTWANGQFRGTLQLSDDLAEQLSAPHGTGRQVTLQMMIARAPLASLPAAGDADGLAGQVQLLEPAGVSVISDLDDTIKHSDVCQRRRLLENTFLREFEAVPGMAEVYGAWNQQRVAFHYVSSSPWQLFECVQEFLVRCGFPWGSVHLRSFPAPGVNLVRLMWNRRSGKLQVIRQIVRRFPQRRFLLVGDSGERDAEIYARIAREFPSQLAHIFIRRLPQCQGEIRTRQALRGLDAKDWTLFDDPGELRDRSLPLLGGEA